MISVKHQARPLLTLLEHRSAELRSSLADHILLYTTRNTAYLVLSCSARSSSDEA